MSEIIRIKPKFNSDCCEKKADLEKFLSMLGKDDVSREERKLFEAAELMEIQFERKNCTIIIVMDLPALLSEQTIRKVELAAVKAVPGMNFRICRFEGATNGIAAVSEEALIASWESIVTAVKIAMPHTTPWLLVSKPVLKGGSVSVMCADEIAFARLKALKCESLFLSEISSRFSGCSEVKLQQGALELPPMEKKAVRESAEKSQFKQLVGTHVPLKAAPARIRDIISPTRYSMLEGRIFGVKVRETRRSAILTAGITDGEDSMRIKMIDPPEKVLTLKDGDEARIGGKIDRDEFEDNELVLAIRDAALIELPKRMDAAEEKRVEFNCHSKFSRLNGLIDLESLIATAKRWRWEGLVLTDDAVVQAFPKFHAMATKAGLKPGLGCQVNLVDDTLPIFRPSKGSSRAADAPLTDAVVVFDLETTGLSAYSNKVIEVGAYKVVDGKIADEFHTFVAPGVALSETVKKITKISDEMLAGAPAWGEALEKFRAFIGDAPLVAHNVDFDAGFLRKDWPKKKPFPALIDTLRICRALFPRIKNFQLGTIAKELRVPLVDAHRADEDARALGRIWLELLPLLKSRDVTKRSHLNRLVPDIEPRKLHANDAVIVVAEQKGVKNLYSVISASNMRHLHMKPKVPWSLLSEKRGGLLVGSGATDGPVIDALLSGADADALAATAKRFDYIEVAPPELYLDKLADGIFASVDEIHELIRSIIALGDSLKIPVIAVSKAYQLERELTFTRKLVRIQKSPNLPPHHLRTTDEMLEDFAFLGEALAKRIVLEAPKRLFDRIGAVAPLPKGFHPPIIAGSDKELRDAIEKRAAELYGGRRKRYDEIPELVKAMIDKEMTAIVGNGFAVLYLIAMRLVKSSVKNGYVVGSRGSVGSSIVAFLAGITEVNPLPPHYRCSVCGTIEFMTEKKRTMGCGPDLVPRICCDAPMIRDGYEIPFEAFMGWEGKKVPDIDLNFAGEYQPRAMKEIEETFGREHVFRAGTINTLKEKNALGIVRKYCEESGTTMKRIEMERHALLLTEVARTTGQHPGGMVIIPKHMEISDFMPVQKPADSEDAESVTTHFDFHSYDTALVKVDVLGHDGPTAIRLLTDLTGVDAMNVPINDPRVLSLFSSCKELGLTESKLGVSVGTLGIPEFGTPLTLDILRETRPTTIEELIRISGVSHGTDVWKGNAQDLIRTGVAKLSEVIATREDIMNGLMRYGVPPEPAFMIMEKVRKGKGLAPQDESLLKKHKVPAWIIDSCRKIKYMFPKAHAVAYVLMSLRIAWFKVYRPEAFYSVWFTLNVGDFNYELAVQGEKAVTKAISEIKKKERERTSTQKEEDQAVVLEVLREMCLRGISLKPVSLFHSHVSRFTPEEKAVRAPFLAVQGLGEKVALKIEQEFSTGEIKSIDDLARRSSLSKTLVEKLKAYGAFEDLPDSNQMVLF